MVGPVQRIGVLQGQQIVDLHGVYAAYLREVRRVCRWQEMAPAILPPDMLKFIEGGEIVIEAVPYALEYAEKQGGQRRAKAGKDMSIN